MTRNWESAVMDKLDHPVLITDKDFKALLRLGQKALMMEDEIVQKVLDEVKGHDIKKPMYAAALFPRIVEAGSALVGELSKWPEPTRQLRFKVGDRVYARANHSRMEAATVLQLWYREDDWPPAWCAPYQMKLEKTGRLIYAPVDSNVWVSDSPDENQKPDAEYDRFEILGYGDKTEYDASTRRGLKSQLHIACAAGRLGELRELLRIPLPEYDPDYNETKTGETPLHIAAFFGRFLCAILLLAAGADPRIPDKKGLTVVKHAERREGHKRRNSEQHVIEMYGSIWDIDATAVIDHHMDKCDALSNHSHGGHPC